MQMGNSQDFILNKYPNIPTMTPPSKRVGEEIPAIITKKWLYGHFEISNTNCGRLYRLVLTSEVLEAIGLTETIVRRRGFKYFTAVQSKQLAQILFQ